MKLNKWIQVALVGCTVLMLAACSSKNKMQDDLALNDGSAAYGDEAGDTQSAGLGDDSKFGDAGSSKHLAANRVYYFDFDSNVVHENDRSAIEANADILAANTSKKAMIEGHTDPRGSREYNIGLGERRAKAVANILTSKGVNRQQVRIVSYGAEKLASQGHSEADYQRDRRGVLTYLQ